MHNSLEILLPRRTNRITRKSTMRVCVVGAGAAGLCAAYHLQREGIAHVVYEQTGRPSGTWVYEEYTPDCHSSMYRDLRTNLPVDVMCYPGFPYPKGLQTFAHHSVVFEYFNNFFKQQIAPHGSVRFHTKVIKMKKKTSNSDSFWEVDVESRGVIHTEEFTHVMVCNGKYSVPRIPPVEGLISFTGKVEHSHGYRVPEKYEGKRVVVVGAGASGVDIALEIAAKTPHCVVSHRSGKPLNLPGIGERGPISRVQGDRLYFGQDDFIENIDYLLFCTGYLISVPFLDDYVQVDNGYRVRDLFRHCILISDPSVAFIGIPSRIIPCLVFDYQVRYAIALFRKDIQLPCKEKMDLELAEDKRQREELGLKNMEATHDLRSPLIWKFLQKFVDEGFGPIDPIYVRGYEAAVSARIKDVVGYRDKPLEF